MAIGATYVTLPQLKSYLKITDTNDDAELQFALDSASRGIEDFCQRQFNDSVVATARLYSPENSRWVIVDDFSTTTGLVVKTDEGDDGVYETTWSTGDYFLLPVNGVVRGRPGWPYWEIRSTLLSRFFPTWQQRQSVQVTAQWGWATVPEPVKQACLILAAETFKLKDAPFGVAGFSDFGAVRVRNNPMAAAMLLPFQRDPMLVVRG